MGTVGASKASIVALSLFKSANKVLVPFVPGTDVCLEKSLRLIITLVLDAAVSRHPGLAFAGASLRGVGLPDVIAGAERAADDILTSLPLPTR